MPSVHGWVWAGILWKSSFLRWLQSSRSSLWRCRSSTLGGEILYLRQNDVFHGSHKFGDLPASWVQRRSGLNSWLFMIYHCHVRLEGWFGTSWNSWRSAARPPYRSPDAVCWAKKVRQSSPHPISSRAANQPLILPPLFWCKHLVRQKPVLVWQGLYA